MDLEKVSSGLCVSLYKLDTFGVPQSQLLQGSYIFQSRVTKRNKQQVRQHYLYKPLEYMWSHGC